MFALLIVALGQPPDAAAALKRASAALREVVAAVKDDAHLRPKDRAAAKVEDFAGESATGATLRYETPDEWPDMPSKPAGPRRENGIVQVTIVRGPAKTGLDTPFLP